MPLDDLIEALDGARQAERAREPHAKQRSVYPRGLPADDAPITPSDVATAINDLFDRHGKMPMTSDIGDCLFTAMEIDNTALAAPGYYAGMGFGVPAGIGVAAATGRRPLILVGDGAFQMTGWELGNCRRYGLDPIVVLFNNKSWEMLRVFQPESHFNDLDDWHFADIAASIGGVRRTGDHAPRARRRARSRGQAARPVLVDRSDAAARRDIRHAGALCLRLQIRPRAHGKGLSGRDNNVELCRCETPFESNKSNDPRSDCCSSPSSSLGRTRAVRLKRPFTQGPYFLRPDNKRQKTRRASHRMAFLRDCPPRPPEILSQDAAISELQARGWSPMRRTNHRDDHLAPAPMG